MILNNFLFDIVYKKNGSHLKRGGLRTSQIKNINWFCQFSELKTTVLGVDDCDTYT